MYVIKEDMYHFQVKHHQVKKISAPELALDPEIIPDPSPQHLKVPSGQIGSA
jgi:hypothetical protein